MFTGKWWKTLTTFQIFSIKYLKSQNLLCQNFALNSITVVSRVHTILMVCIMHVQINDVHYKQAGIHQSFPLPNIHAIQ